MQSIAFHAKQIMKMILQCVVLPLTYGFWRVIYGFQKPKLIILADAHHDSMPFSLQRMEAQLEKRGYRVTKYIRNYSKMSARGAALSAMGFMRLYAQAKYVFICDNFLPVVSCKKRKETKVIQLWHACGVMKKMGYDAADDIPHYYRASVYRNYDLVTVSAPECTKYLCSAMRLSEQIVRPLGVSRTDFYFDPTWIAQCKADFYRQHPQAKGKTVILWAPTFRGNAEAPYLVGAEDILALEAQLGEDYYFLYKVHPHIETHTHLSNCAILTERLLPVADLMITDYSSVLYDFMFFKKPLVLYAPDFHEYDAARGLYLSYETLSPFICKTSRTLLQTVKAALEQKEQQHTLCRQRYLSACDGNATARILQTIHLDG